MSDAMLANLIKKSTKRSAATVTVAVRLADLAEAFGVVGATSVRIPSYGGAIHRTVEFIFECAQEELPA